MLVSLAAVFSIVTGEERCEDNALQTCNVKLICILFTHKHSHAFSHLPLQDKYTKLQLSSKWQTNKWKCLMIRRQNSDLVYSSFHILYTHIPLGHWSCQSLCGWPLRNLTGATGFGWCSQRGMPRWWLGTRWQHMKGRDRSYVIVSHCRCKGQDVNQIEYQNSHQLRQISVPFL